MQCLLNFQNILAQNVKGGKLALASKMFVGEWDC